jgi:hypothetical protein
VGEDRQRGFWASGAAEGDEKVEKENRGEKKVEQEDGGEKKPAPAPAPACFKKTWGEDATLLDTTKDSFKQLQPPGLTKFSCCVCLLGSESRRGKSTKSV